MATTVLHPCSRWLQNRRIGEHVSGNYACADFVALEYIKAGKDQSWQTKQGDFVVQSNATVTFTSAGYVELLPGFEVEAGAVFIAKTELMPDCSAGKKSAGNEDSTPTPEVLTTEMATPAWQVFPNPAQTNVTIVSPSEKDGVASIALYDLQGNNILSQALDGGLSQVSVDLPAVAGLYLLRVTTVSGNTHLTKLVINNL